MQIRSVDERDAAELALLLAQMGRTITPAEAWSRVERQLVHDDYGVWGARLESRLVGLAIGQVRLTTASDAPAATLGLLVVDGAAREQGIGTALVAEFEQWAIARGAMLATVTSAHQRHDAHRLYQRLGFENTGVRFVKRLAD